LGAVAQHVAYLVSFLTIGVIWLNHHRIFEQVARVDGPLLLLNSTCCCGRRSSRSPQQLSPNT